MLTNRRGFMASLLGLIGLATVAKSAEVVEPVKSGYKYKPLANELILLNNNIKAINKEIENLKTPKKA